MKVKLLSSVILLTLTAACTGTGESGGAVPLAVGYIPYNGSAPTLLGIEKNIYEAHGLALDMKIVQSPAPAIAGVVSGDMQIAWATITNVVAAVSQGTQIRCVAPVDGVVTEDKDQLGTALVVPADSPIQDATDLEGAKVGVPAIGSNNHLWTLEIADRAGIDASSIEFVQVPLPQMQAAIERGDLDAAAPTQPFTNQIRAAGGRVISWLDYDVAGPGATLACYAASAQYIEDHPDVIQRFIDAQTEAINYAADHVDVVRATLPTFLDVTPEQGRAAALQVDYIPRLNTDSIESTQELMTKWGFIEKPSPLDQLVYVP